jgi:2-oxoglutarate dehydrogenase complex dehydrogenase (E1) component-like enzyme
VYNKPADTASSYGDQMYDQWRNDPDSVDASWASHFSGTPQKSSTSNGMESQIAELL